MVTQSHDLSKFSENLKFLRNKHKLTGAELAKKLNIGRSALSSWETGRHYPHLEDVIKISEFFDISIDNLLGVNKKRFKYEIISNNDKVLKENFNKEIEIMFEELTLLTESELKDVRLAIDLIKAITQHKK